MKFKIITFFVISSLLSFFLFINTNISHAQQCGKTCSSNSDCGSGLACMENGVCGIYCQATGSNCTQILNSWCNTVGYSPVGRGTNSNCTCNCVDTNSTSITCSSDSECSSGYLCDNSGQCSKIIFSCPPCTTSTSGENGACTASMACPVYPVSWIKTANPSCPTNTDVCCVEPGTPISGTQGCGQTCNPPTSSCLTNLTCVSSISRCVSYPGDTSCNFCYGDSGKGGVCLDGTLCGNMGYATDGHSTCPSDPSIWCCTDTANTTCTIAAISQLQANSDMTFNIQTNTPNTKYYIATNPATCAPTSPTTDSTGYATFHMNCPIGNFTIYASTTTFPSTNPNCTLSISTADIYGQCGVLCTDNFYPKGYCVLTGTTKPLGCARPPSDPNGNIDCDMDGDGVKDDADCWCCGNQAEPRSSASPLCGTNGISTAIGCLPTGDKNAFLAFILRWALGISGGTSFILIIYSGFTIMTAGGDKRKLQAGKELLTAAVSGLLLIIFSVFILDFIGIRILKIPGL